MQCTSYTPLYYHARDLNGASGYSWHPYDHNAGGYGEERGYNISMPPRDQFLVYDKEVLRRIIQNHEATFRTQVQELHRLYSRQRDLMDEMRMSDSFAHQMLSRTSESNHSLSHAGAEFSQKRSPTTNWLFANLSPSELSEPSGNVQGPGNHSLSHAGAEFSQKRSPTTNWLTGNLSPSELSELADQASGDVQGPGNHSLSHARAEFSQKRSPTTNWLLLPSELSELASGDVRGPGNSVAEYLKKPTTLRTDSFIQKNSNIDVQFLSQSCKRNGNEIVNLELPADMYHDDQGKQFKVGNLSEAPELTCHTPDGISKLQPASHSDIGSIKEWDSSSSNSSIRRRNCFIDLNEPLQLEILPPSSPGPLEFFTGHNRTVCSEECVPFEAIPESVVPRHSQLLKSDGSSDGINSSMAIDLNSMPADCFSETEVTLEIPRSMDREAKELLDCSSACNHAMGPEDEPIVHNKIADSFLKTGPYIDLNCGLVEEHPLPLSSSPLEIKSTEETELKGPVSPENEERSPPRGKSEDIQLETPPLYEQGEGEPFIELDTIAAQMLVKIFSSEVQEHMGSAVLESLDNFENLCWLAEIVSSTGDDIDYEVMKLENDQVKGNALNLSHFKKSKGTGDTPERSRKGQKKGKKRRKDLQTESPATSTSLQRGPLKRKAGRNAGARPRKHSKSSPPDVTKKSMRSILKQSAACTDQGILQSWGKIRKRGGRRRMATKFLVIS